MYANCDPGYRPVRPITLTDNTLAINDYASEFIVVDPVSGRQLYKWPSSTVVGLSPDGRTIAFVGGDRGVNLFFWEVDSSQARRLTNLSGYDYGFDIWWTPDGKRVLFDVGPSKTQSQKCRIGNYVSDDELASCIDVFEYDVPSGAVRLVGRTVHYLP
jgi:Tol biopolymer transport system component